MRRETQIGNFLKIEALITTSRACDAAGFGTPLLGIGQQIEVL